MSAGTLKKIVLIPLRVLLIALAVFVGLSLVVVLTYAVLVQPIALAHVAGAWVCIVSLLLATYSKSFNDVVTALVAAGVGAFFFLFSSMIYDKIRLETSRPHLPTIVSDIVEDPRACPGRCYVDSSEPPVVFVVWGGFLSDEWGVCFDPGGKISTPRETRALLPYGEQFPDSVVHLRNGATTHGRLRRDWYSCGID